MKKFIAVASGALIASTASAFAGGYVAPVVEAPVIVAPVTPVAPDMNWSGFYLGAQAGKMNATAKAPAAGTALVAPGDIDYDATTYGLYAGYLHDFGRFVGGAELSWDKVKDFKADGADNSTNGSIMRGKLLAGYDAGRMMPYLTVGYANLKLDGANGAADQDGDGYLYGLGAKFKATDNVLVGAEVLRHEFKDFNDTDGNDLKATTFGLNVSYQF